MFRRGRIEASESKEELAADGEWRNPSNQTQIVIKLRRYCPIGQKVDSNQDFEVCSNAPIPTPSEVQPGECLVQNLYLSLDPAIRGWMTAGKGSYLPPLKLGSIMRGSSLGKVIYSKSETIKVGGYVNCVPDAIGWAQYGIAKESLLIPIRTYHHHHHHDGGGPIRIPIRAWAGVLGGTGLTAYFGLSAIGKPQPNDTIVVSAAAGAVGSIAVQLARNVYHCRVIGIAGGDRKCEWLKTVLKVDEAVDYQSPEFASKLKASIGPGGANVVFDNVGGKVLDSMLKHLAKNARVVLCGAVSAMNEGGPIPIQNIMTLIVKSASMTGFTLFDYSDRYEEAYKNVTQYICEGKVTFHEDIVYGLENAPKAFLKLFGADGGNFGKLVVVLHPGLETNAANM